MTPDREALAPCPFCGSPDVASSETADERVFIFCGRCGASGPEGVGAYVEWRRLSEIAWSSPTATPVVVTEAPSEAQQAPLPETGAKQPIRWWGMQYVEDGIDHDMVEGFGLVSAQPVIPFVWGGAARADIPSPVTDEMVAAACHEFYLDGWSFGDAEAMRLALAAALAAHPDHASDCAVHNGPAYPAGDCDCRTADCRAAVSRGTDLVATQAEAFERAAQAAKAERHNREGGTCAFERGAVAASFNIEDVIRALSPLPPNSRVVVIPADVEHILTLALAGELESFTGQEQSSEVGWVLARAALRAMTEEGKL